MLNSLSFSSNQINQDNEVEIQRPNQLFTNPINDKFDKLNMNAPPYIPTLTNTNVDSNYKSKNESDVYKSAKSNMAQVPKDEPGSNTKPINIPFNMKK